MCMNRRHLPTAHSLCHGNAVARRAFTISLPSGAEWKGFLKSVFDRLVRQLTPRRAGAGHWLFAVCLLVSCAWLAVAATTRAPGGDKLESTGASPKGQQDGAAYRPTPKQWHS